LRKSLFRQIQVNGRLIIGVLGALVIHGGLWFGNRVYSKPPRYTVVVSPSVLDVTLVKAAPATTIFSEPIPRLPAPIQPDQPADETFPNELVELASDMTEWRMPESKPEVMDVTSLTEPHPVEEIAETGDVIREEDQLKDDETVDQDRSPEPPEAMDHQHGAMSAPSPVAVQNKPPRYPREARRRGWEGQVILKVLVRGDGSVEDLRVIESSGYDVLDDAAARALRRWRFEPAFRFGQPVRGEIDIPVVFQLK
jgi:periplasmic protein TonB